MKISYHDVQTDVLIMQAESGYTEAVAMQIFRDMNERIDTGLRKIIYDCSNLDFISSLDLGLLARIRSKIAMAKGDLKLCSAKGMVPEVLEITNMNKVFEMYPDLNSALEAFANFQVNRD